MKKEETLYCCICGNKIEHPLIKNYFGNNPEGAMWKDTNGNIIDPVFPEGSRCCDECDNRFVIPGRMYRYAQSKKNNK